MASLWTHDFTLESVGGTAWGFMFPRGQNGRRPYVVRDYQTLAPRQLTMGEVTAAELPPEVELTWFQDDWGLGIGGRNTRTADKKIQSSLKVDIDAEGRLVLARDTQSTTVSLAPAEYKATGFATVGTEVWGFIGRDVFEWSYANIRWQKGTQPQNVAVIYRNGVDYDGKTYVPAWLVADDSAGTYIYKADADAAWTLSTLTLKTPKYFAVADGKLWGANWGSGATHHIRSTTDGGNTGAWSGPTEIGESDSEITGLVGDGDSLIVCKTNGLWAFYADGSVENLTPEFEGMAHPDNFRGAFNWNSYVLLPWGAGGLAVLRNGQLYDISFRKEIPTDTTLHGRVVAIHGDSLHVYVMVYESANTRYHILVGNAVGARQDGTPIFSWRHLARISYTTSTDADHGALMVEGIPSGATIHHRLLVGVESGGSNLLPYVITSDSGTDVAEAYSDDTDVQAVTVEWDANFAKTNKRFSAIDFVTLGLGSGANDNYIEVKYRVDGGAWTYVTGAQATSKLTTSPQTLTFASGITGKKIELQFLLFRGTTATSTPKLVSFTVKAQLRLAAIKALPLQIYLADGQVLLNGARQYRSATDLAQLRAWNAQAAEVVLRMPGGRTFTCVALPGTMVEEEVAKHDRKRAEYVASMVFAEA